jgi:hypothetical protein
MVRANWYLSNRSTSWRLDFVSKRVVIPAKAHCCPRNFRNIRERENHAENQLLPLLAEPVLDSIGEGGWEGVSTCGKASGKC